MTGRVRLSYILSIDAGTTGIRSIIFDKENNIISQAYSDIPTIYPKPGWVEQEPKTIWNKCLQVVNESLKNQALNAQDIQAIGITNQRSTSVIWDKVTGEPIYNAISWQDMRASDLCREKMNTLKMRAIKGVGSILKTLLQFVKPISASEFGKLMITISSLSINPGTALSNIAWMLNNIEGAKERAKKGEIIAGTLDTWLIWNLTNAKVHATDYSNASSTNMYDTFKLQWSSLFLDLFDIPKQILPEVRESSDDYGNTSENHFGSSIPITGVIADQQSALFAETCFTPGDIKCTHGTGTFIDMNVGSQPVATRHRLVPLIGWSLDGQVTYMLEGYINTTGSAVQWLCEGLQIINDPSEAEILANNVDDSGGVFFVPALQGLTSPYWDPLARGVIIGLTRGTKKEHIVRALLEAIAYRCRDVITAMEHDSGLKIKSIKTDGNASKNNFLIQFMADLMEIEIERPQQLEATALGAAYLAGLKTGYWKSIEDIKQYRKTEKTFQPKQINPQIEENYIKWKKAIERSFNWG